MLTLSMEVQLMCPKINMCLGVVQYQRLRRFLYYGIYGAGLEEENILYYCPALLCSPSHQACWEDGAVFGSIQENN